MIVVEAENQKKATLTRLDVTDSEAVMFHCGSCVSLQGDDGYPGLAGRPGDNGEPVSIKCLLRGWKIMFV